MTIWMRYSVLAGTGSYCPALRAYYRALEGKQ